MQAQLVPADGGPPITLKSRVTVVGRKEGLCDLVLDLRSVSKLHCALVKTHGLLFVRDLGSTNGTKVNGQRITRGALLPGDELAFASTRFRVHLAPDEGEAQPGDRTEALSALSDSSAPDGAANDRLPESLLRELSQDASSDSDVRLLSDEDEE